LYAQNVSADGLHVLAAFVGQDTDEAWTLDLHTHRLKRLTVGREPVVPGTVSADGRTVLVAAGDPLGPPRDETVEALPFGGGRATVVVRHAGSPTWNR
jgi:acyl-coenzyme A thioesterase PaaI-like protein